MADTGRTNTAAPQPTGGRRRRDRSRGAVLVEAAIIFPILVLLTFGAVEFGLVFHDELILTTAARSGARIGTADKNTAGTLVNTDDDYQILQAVSSALGGLGNKVVSITIYDAGSATSGPPAGCYGVGATGSSTPGQECNVYPESDLTQPSTYWTATGPPESQFWPVSARSLSLNTTAGTEPAYLGVAVTTTHGYVTGLFGPSRTLTEYSVFRFEPTANTSRANPVAPLNGTTSTTSATTTTVAGGGSSTTSSSTTSTTHAPTSSTTSTSTTISVGIPT